jgi:hypothetical protein
MNVVYAPCPNTARLSRHCLWPFKLYGHCGSCTGYQVLSGPFPAPKRGRPIFIAMIDISTGPDFLELVKLAVTAAVEALPPNTLVGIITLSDCVRCPLDAETIKACKYQVA